MELDEVIVTPSKPESSAAREDVPVVPTPTGEEINDDDQGTSDQVATELRVGERSRNSKFFLRNTKIYLWRDQQRVERGVHLHTLVDR